MRSILVVVTRQIGDVLLTTPLIRFARQRWPEAAIDVLGFEGTLGMLRGNPDVRELIATPARVGLAGALRLAGRLWRRYDLALVADVGDRAHILGAIAARTRAGVLPASNGSNWWKKALLSHVVTAAGDLGDVHVVEERMALLSPWRDAEPSSAVVVPPPAAPLPPELKATLRARYVVVHSPSMWPYKQWPAGHFCTLVSELTAKGRQVVLTRGPSQQDAALVASLVEAAPVGRAIDAGLLDFQQLATLLQEAALYIGPDTSISHLAAATGVPVIAIFGPTNPMRWSPWPVQGEARLATRGPIQRSGNVILLQSELPCVPCGRAGCEDHRQSRSDCLMDIGPERVIAEADRILSARS
jgi:heptosyltransferase-3